MVLLISSLFYINLLESKTMYDKLDEDECSQVFFKFGRTMSECVVPLDALNWQAETRPIFYPQRDPNREIQTK
jgi:hypothetical protein